MKYTKYMIKVNLYIGQEINFFISFLEFIEYFMATEVNVEDLGLRV